MKWNLCLIVVCCLVSLGWGQACTLADDQFLVTFHPHLDAFWLNIDTELKDINFRPAGFLYAMNQRNSKTIFNSMLEALLGDANRKYFVTQSVFFKDWYEYLQVDKKEQVKKILKNGQLEIANGGWVENDEAVCYYDDILDQYTLGMSFLYDEFNYQVKIGWATDSFGHSHSQAALQHLLGIEFQGIERVDDRYVNAHFEKPLLEFYWNTISDSNNISYGGVLNHVRHFLHEVNNLRGGRIPAIKEDFMQIQKAMKNHYYHKNKLFRFLGNDFEEFISQEFASLQTAMTQLNREKGQNCPEYKYGNPLDYLQLLTKYYNQNPLPTRKWDLMNNWDQDRFWTGYFTTDPLLKRTCKDFSRLVNFYRKSLLSLGVFPQNQIKLRSAEELLAVLQHHDGITATSKVYIEDEFRNRMKRKSDEIISSIKQIHGGNQQIVCNFYQKNNECEITDIASSGAAIKALYIITHGGSKSEKIELILPNGVFFDIEEVEEDIFCQELKCTLVFEANLHPGANKFTMSSKPRQLVASSIIQMEQAPGMTFSGRDFVIGVDPNKKNQIKYQYGDGQHFTIGLYTSPNQGSSRQTVSWDKYGKRNDKIEYVVPGMYIMSNTGNIEPFLSTFSQLKVGEGKTFKRVIVNSSPSNIKITIKNDEPNIIDVLHTFRPESRNMVDYFMKVSSNVKSDTLFHDSNGFLVSKRILNTKPDYDFKMKNEDLINGNTYPACSFAYLIDSDKKFLFFTDRAQGVASFQKDLLINFDRLAMDDGKGVGQGYSKTVTNTWRYKFAVISNQDDSERTWQRAYDEALIGFLIKSSSPAIKYRSGPAQQIAHTPGLGPMNNLKYSIFYLNSQEYVIRFQNMGEFATLMMTKYTGALGHFEWNIEELGLNLVFFDIKESYANGVVKEEKLRWRRHWGKADDQVNVLNQGRNDSDKFYLRPLEIRSFRIKQKGAIAIKNVINNAENNPVLGELKNTKPLTSLRFRKRCF